jgi:hypothetical protein
LPATFSSGVADGTQREARIKAIRQPGTEGAAGLRELPIKFDGSGAQGGNAIFNDVLNDGGSCAVFDRSLSRGNRLDRGSCPDHSAGTAKSISTDLAD